MRTVPLAVFSLVVLGAPAVLVSDPVAAVPAAPVRVHASPGASTDPGSIASGAGAVAPSTLVAEGLPATTPPRIATPRSLAVIGDSISQGTGSNGPGAPGGAIGAPRPASSWATGDRDGLDSYADRLDEAAGGSVVRVNLSANGATMRDHVLDQVRRVPTGTDLVVVQLGGNDLCRTSEDEMTQVEEYRERFREALAWLAEHRPDTLVQVSSIPDLYSLWYVRGAPHRGEQWPVLGFVVSGREGPRAARSFEENHNKRMARLFWDSLRVVPCRTLLFRPNVPRNAGPTPDPINTAEQRRLRVRERNVAFNRVLEEECAVMLRCRFDDHAVFDLTSNRDARGVLLADKEQWGFVDADISTQDHFHPSFAGQRKLAEVAWRSGFDWGDTVPPVVRVRLSDSDHEELLTTGIGIDRWSPGPTGIEVVATDDAGVRGIEYRVHASGDAGAGRGSGWSAVVGDRLLVPVESDGVTVVEVRAVDVNGNVGASGLVVVGVDADPPVAEVVLGSIDDTVVLGTPLSVRVRCSDARSGVAACVGQPGHGRPVDTSRIGHRVVRADAADAAGNTTSVGRVVRVVYATSGVVGPDGSLASGSLAAAEHPLGTPVPIGILLEDARGRPATEARIDVTFVAADGTEFAAVPARSGREASGGWKPSWWWGRGSDGAWSTSAGGHVFVADTSVLAPGPWTVVVRPDDGSVHRADVVLTGAV